MMHACCLLPVEAGKDHAYVCLLVTYAALTNATKTTCRELCCEAMHVLLLSSGLVYLLLLVTLLLLLLGLLVLLALITSEVCSCIRMGGS
jgi:hypothetical protein